MLSLQKITITHYKNYEVQSFDFEKNIIGICGSNGKGKTNLLDAVYYSCFTKSYFPGSDTLNIHFNQEGFRIESSFVNNLLHYKVVCIQRNNCKKELYLNDVLYEKLSHHIGLLPAVMIAPDDIEIINGGSEGRRKYMDTILCQLDADYLNQLIVYNKILQQRNSLLKNLANKKINDVSLLEIIDQQLINPCNIIFSKRMEFAATLIPLVVRFYQQIANNEEKLQVEYESNLKDFSIQDLLEKNKEKDFLLQRTNAGIHKDDLRFELDGLLFKNIASQGQKKSLLFALKLAEYEIIKNTKGFSPILLLDDVFEKLDDDRMNNLLEWVCNKNKGQVFITDTHKERLTDVFDRLGVNGQIIDLGKM
jgi:DNA replication and repair protein RecF